ncbi:hypothetical protein EJ08DRAFT_735731 [Tothia fuscella]|uniref:Uncharacterized protein n=1 Tax=Tothia fuscella TaxID=1048955 RepID=A0A9P4NNE6_9PEZI|nr:hypothetical protein EJ08DRAFT_735731 [Tothia fuscella]
MDIPKSTGNRVPKWLDGVPTPEPLDPIPEVTQWTPLADCELPNPRCPTTSNVAPVQSVFLFHVSNNGHKWYCPQYPANKPFSQRYVAEGTSHKQVPLDQHKQDAAKMVAIIDDAIACLTSKDNQAADERQAPAKTLDQPPKTNWWKRPYTTLGLHGVLPSTATPHTPQLTLAKMRLKALENPYVLTTVNDRINRWRMQVEELESDEPEAIT